MLDRFLFDWNPWLLPVGLLMLLGSTVELTYRFWRFPTTSISEDAWGATQTGIVTLVAFIIGFSFAQASARFDSRRELVVREANAIGTTWLRADNLQPGLSTEFRRTLTDYTATRLAAYGRPADRAEYATALNRSNQYQARLWSISRSALHERPQDLGASLLMQSLNEAIDVSDEQLQALTHHVPSATIGLTILLSWIGAFSLGLRFARNKSRPVLMSALTIVAYTLILTMIVDYDRPQSGFITVSLAPLATQLQSMQAAP